MVYNCLGVLVGCGVAYEIVGVVLRRRVQGAGTSLKIHNLVDFGVGSLNEEAEQVVELVGEDGG